MADDAREAAIQRLNDKRAFWTSLGGYVFVSLVMVLIWALSGRNYFWPIWFIGFGGLGIALQAWRTFGQKPITEADIDREMKRGGG